jgi:hypothetical protein
VKKYRNAPENTRFALLPPFSLFDEKKGLEFPFKENLGEEDGMELHMRRVRQARRLTLAAASASTRRSISGLSNIERGLQAVTLETVELLARTYNVHPWDLVSFPEFPAPPCCQKGEPA